jgi:hypothetical protein
MGFVRRRVGLPQLAKVMGAERSVPDRFGGQMSTSKRVARKASKELQSKKTTRAEKSVAASALSQTKRASKSRKRKK